jgi:GntR family transcriptional regulator, transcriptional repressor for pyruvate dehydrogenase complex
MSLRALGRPPLGELAARELRERLAAGTWQVGERLPSEVELARQLGVGRSTVREAIRVLVHSGLLETRQGAGTFVVALASAPEWEGRVRRAALLEVYELREALELQASRLAVARRTDADLDRIERALHERERCRLAARDEAFVDADLAFHRAVVAAAHNALLEEMFGSFLLVLREALLGVVDDRALEDDDVELSHHDLLAAIRARDADAAVEATRRNVTATADVLRALLG